MEERKEEVNFIIRITSQFHEFLNLIFGGFLSFGTNVRYLVTPLLSRDKRLVANNKLDL